MKRARAEYWEALARRQGYFAVLAHDGSLQVAGDNTASPEFFATGEADVAAVLSAAASIVGHEVSLASSLDFGCGAGRLTIPIARRARTVTACDIAPTMLAHARRNAETAGLRNITYIGLDELFTLPLGTFTFVCSLLVLQYVPRSIGYDIIRTLVRLLAPGGIAVLHVKPGRSGGALRHFIRLFRARSIFQRGSPRTRRSRAHDDDVQTYSYDERAVLRAIRAADGEIAGRCAAHAGDTTGSVLVIQKAV